MTIHHSHLQGAIVGDDIEAIEQVVAEVEDDIQHGRVTDDVSRLLEQRLLAAGVMLTPEAIDDLAEAIETDVSL